ncbi:AMP-binding protein [Catenulispora rubra]|uniref:AMP-binding protein n=1 Tax=Catenulispora rubra TaxID=280293 RepID=UPI0018920030|nr:AMP-binding protein [Catenulispora rubra]
MLRAELYPGVELPRDGLLNDLLHAESARPEAPAIRFSDGQTWSVGELARRARACAATLRAHGVDRGDRVAILGRGDLRMFAWFCGIYLLGAVEGQVNTDLRGPVLRHVMDDLDPALIVAKPEGAAALDELGGHWAPVIDFDDDFPAEGLADFDMVPSRPGDLAAIMYTSGTSGPSKGVMLSQGYFSNLGAVLAGVYHFGPDDVIYHLMSLYHVDSHMVLAGCLQTGAVLAVPDKFSASRFWQQMSAVGATGFLATGSMLAAIRKNPPPDPSLPLKAKWGLAAPLPEDLIEYYKGLGITIVEGYGQTEANLPVVMPLDASRLGGLGIACSAFDIAIHTPEDREVPTGEHGEIVYRPNYPDVVTMGYWGRPEATLANMRGLWWHTGDRGFIDDDGYLYFVGRLKDSLRYRGENVSAWELEQIVRQAPGLVDAAAIGVIDELGGEDEIKVFVVLEDGAAFDPEGLFAYCEQNLARFAVPRYVEPISATAVVRSPGTGVIQKHLLPTEHGAQMSDRLKRTT